MLNLRFFNKKKLFKSVLFTSVGNHVSVIVVTYAVMFVCSGMWCWMVSSVWWCPVIQNYPPLNQSVLNPDLRSASHLWHLASLCFQTWTSRSVMSEDVVWKMQWVSGCHNVWQGVPGVWSNSAESSSWESLVEWYRQQQKCRVQWMPTDARSDETAEVGRCRRAGKSWMSSQLTAVGLGPAVSAAEWCSNGVESDHLSACRTVSTKTSVSCTVVDCWVKSEARVAAGGQRQNNPGGDARSLWTMLTPVSRCCLLEHHAREHCTGRFLRGWDSNYKPVSAWDLSKWDDGCGGLHMHRNCMSTCLSNIRWWSSMTPSIVICWTASSWTPVMDTVDVTDAVTCGWTLNTEFITHLTLAAG